MKISNFLKELRKLELAFIMTLLFVLNAVSAQIDTNKLSDNIITMTQEDYFQFGIRNKSEIKLPFLDRIRKVDNTGQTLNLYGYIPEDNCEYSSEFQSVYYKMKSNEYYLIKLTRSKERIYKLSDQFLLGFCKECKWSFSKTIKRVIKSASIMTVPYKVRPGNETLSRITTSGINNVAINFDFFKWGWQRYYQNSKSHKWRFSLGGMVSPGVEEISNNQLRNSTSSTEGSTKELFISSGFTVNASFNDISFTLIPAGWDFGTSTTAKSWNYNGRRWWGFGLGLSPKFLGPPSSQTFE